MWRGIAAAAAVFAIALPGAAQAQGPPGQGSAAGADGVDDPYFPQEGNSGYDVRNYDLTLGYDPATDHLDGLALIKARATQTLGSFHLDLQGLEVHSVRVNDVPAPFTRDGTWTSSSRPGSTPRRSAPAGRSGGVRGGPPPCTPSVLSLPLSNSGPFHLLREA